MKAKRSSPVSGARQGVTAAACGRSVRRSPSEDIQKRIGMRRSREMQVQTRLMVGASNDPAEKEADKAADRVLRMADGGCACAACSGDETGKIRPSGTEGGGMRISRSVEDRIRRMEAGGEPLSVAVRAKMEPAFGRDFGGVRIHRDAEAEETSGALGAKAYAHGNHIAFARGQYAPGLPSGDHLIAHELAHVNQSEAGYVRRYDGEDEEPVPTIENDPDVTDEDRFRSQLRVELAEEINELIQSEDCHAKSYGQRASLLLLFGSRSLPGNDAGVEAYREWLFVTADVEDRALTELPGSALDELPAAFPETWATLFSTLLMFNRETEREYFVATADNYSELVVLLSRLPEQIWDHGLPVPFESAGSIGQFHLSPLHAALENAHPAKVFAEAGLSYTRALWRYAFYARWNRSIEALEESIRECRVAPNVAAYDNFQENFAETFASIPERLAAARSEENLSAVETSAIEMQEAIFAIGLLTGFEALIGILAGWSNTQDLFDAGVAGADGLVAGAEDIDRFLHALSWAREHGYFGAAGEQIVNAILENGVEILATTLAIIAAGIAVQFVPGLNIAFDVALFLYGGFTLLDAIDNIAQVVSEVFAATTTLQLQRKSARLAHVLLADGATSFVDIVLFFVSLRGLRSKANDIRRSTGVADEEAFRRALRETDDEVSRALQRGADYDTWEAGLNQETRQLFRQDEGLRRFYQSIDPGVRRLLTLCRSPCIPINPRPSAAALDKIEGLMNRFSVADDNNALREYLHANRNNLDSAVSSFDAITSGRQLRSLYDEAIKAYAQTRGGTARRNSRGRWEFTRNSDGAIVREYEPGGYGTLGAARGTDSFFQAHHGIQGQWARDRGIPGYSYPDAPAILLRDRRAGSPHRVITSRQSGRRTGRSSRTYAEERQNLIDDFRAAEVPDGIVRDQLSRQDAYFGGLYRAAEASGSTLTQLQSWFGTWTP